MARRGVTAARSLQRSRAMIRAGLVVACVIAATSFAEAGGPAAIALPPLEVDVGATVPIRGGEAIQASTDVLVGIHWASLYWKPTKWDIGIGFVGSYRPYRTGPRTFGERTYATTTTADEDTAKLRGTYLTLSRTLVSYRSMRTWIDLRGELLRVDAGGRSTSALGGAIRVATELYWAGVGGASDRNAFALFAGTFALGVFVELSQREVAPELGPTGVTSGVSIRIPFLLAVAG